jgi:hypothetical protein
MCKDFGCRLLAKIPFDPKIQALIDLGKSIFDVVEEDQLKESPAIQAYHDVAKLLEEELKEK